MNRYTSGVLILLGGLFTVVPDLDAQVLRTDILQDMGSDWSRGGTGEHIEFREPEAGKREAVIMNTRSYAPGTYFAVQIDERGNLLSNLSSS